MGLGTLGFRSGRLASGWPPATLRFGAVSGIKASRKAARFQGFRVRDTDETGNGESGVGYEARAPIPHSRLHTPVFLKPSP